MDLTKLLLLSVLLFLAGCNEGCDRGPWEGDCIDRRGRDICKGYPFDNERGA